MSLLGGWIASRPVAEPEQVLSAMMAWPVSLAQPGDHRFAAPNAGLGVLGWESTVDLFSDAGLHAAIEGQAHWADSRYGALAEQGGPAQAMALAYRELGRDGLLRQIQGPCAFAVIEPAQGRALLAIDRIGVRPLCYAVPGNQSLVFGTTTDSVAAHPLVEPAIDVQSLSDYLFFTRVPAPETVDQSIRKLMPGQYLSYENGQVEVDFYWQISYRPGETGRGPDFDELAAGLVQTLDRAMERSLKGLDPARVGAFLSGGIDSSTLTGLLAKCAPETATAFTIGFDEPGYDEFEFARSAARHFGVKQHEYVVTPGDIVAIAPRLAEIYDEPFANTSAVAAYYCARMAREEGILTLLAGDGGDELFGGNDRYAKQGVFEAYGRVPAFLRRRVIEPLLAVLPGDFWLLCKARSYVTQATVRLPDRLELYNNYMTFALRECFQDDVAAAIDQRHGFEVMRYHYDSTHGNTRLNRMLHLDMRTTLADDDLRKVGRTCELANIQVRFPLLDEELVAFSARVPLKLKLKGKALRYFYKRALCDFLPPTTLRKSKQGFGLPFGQWLKTDRRLQEFTYDTIKMLSQRQIFKSEFLKTAVERHETGHPSFHGELVWVLLMLELWFESREARYAGVPSSYALLAQTKTR